MNYDPPIVVPIWYPLYINFARVADILHTQPDSLALPTKMNCSICSDRLTVYPDTYGGEWVYCPGCCFGGDLLEYTCKFWKSDLHTTIQKLSYNEAITNKHMLSIDNIERYNNKVIKHRQRIRDVWDRLSNRSYRDKEDRRRIHDVLCLAAESDPNRWQKQMQPFIGWSERAEVELEYYHEDSKGHQDRILIGGKKAEWKDVIALNFKDLPGRIAGVMLGGRQLEYPEDWAMRPLKSNSVHGQGLSSKDVGFGFYEASLSYSNKFGPTTFVVTKPKVALRLHSRWFKDYETILPLVLAHPGPIGATRSVYRTLPERTWVFWSPEIDVEIFVQAALARGRLSIFPIEDANYTNYLAWLHRVRGLSVPWHVLFDKIFPMLTAGQIDKFAYTFADMPDEWAYVLRNISKQNADILQAAFKPKYPVNSYDVTTKTVQRHEDGSILKIEQVSLTETEHGWYINKTMISDVLLRIDKVAEFEKSADLLYSMRAIYHGVDYPFMVKQSELIDANQLISKIEHVLVSAKAGLPKFNPLWKDRLYDIAKYFSVTAISSIEEIRQTTKPNKGSKRSGKRAINTRKA